MELKDRTGERRIMNCGEEAEIVEYINNKNILVRFLKTGEVIRSTYNCFKNGTIVSHFIPSVCKVGIVGLEKVKENGKHLKSYESWRDMLRRCYDKKLQRKRPTYIGCKVCEEWLYYPNFKKWYEENYYEIEGQKMMLDKDILVKGNKVYSPDTCMIVPSNINTLFIKNDKNRGNCPVGVTWVSRDKKFQPQCNIFDIETGKSKHKSFKTFKNKEEAFELYKRIKEENIKQVADYYKYQIPKKLYEAMYKYEVHIDD
ncbi:TPA: hypothetical protein ACF2DE_002879 [Clostridium perfringens]